MYKIGELAEIVNISIDTIRYYEKIGLIPRPNRDDNEYRIYSVHYIKLLQFIILCKSHGFKLREIIEIIDLINNKNRDNNKLKNIVNWKIKDINQKIKELVQLKSELNEIVDTCLSGECSTYDFHK